MKLALLLFGLAFIITLWIKSNKSNPTKINESYPIKNKGIESLKSGDISVYLFLLRDRESKRFGHWTMGTNRIHAISILEDDLIDDETLNPDDIEVLTMKNYDFNKLIRDNNIKDDAHIIENFMLLMETKTLNITKELK